MSYRLYIPGPVQVSEKTYRALQTPVIGHRSSDFVALYQGLQPALQNLFGTRRPVYLSTSSAWGVMEAAVRNLSVKRVLCCMCGAFSDKWLEVSHRCGKEADPLQVEWGQAIEPEAVRRALATGRYDALTLIHNETSTGLMNPLAEIMAVAREFPEVMSIVDTVSSFSAMPIPMDELGIDVLLTGSQKALALPPGLALFSVSARALERAKSVPARGYYFDFVEFQKNHEKGMTPSTPVLPLIFALRSKLEDIAAEGLEARYARHARLNARLIEWCESRGFPLFPERRFASKTLVCARNDRRLDLKAWNNLLKKRHHCMFNTGYGKIEGITLRISNMGDETDQTIATLLDQLDDTLASLTGAPNA